METLWTSTKWEYIVEDRLGLFYSGNVAATRPRDPAVKQASGDTSQKKKKKKK